MSIIIKDTLHPENESGTDIYPKTSTDQVVGYGQDANGKDFATVDDTCKKPINIGAPTHVLGVEGSSSNQPISIPIGNDRNNIPKRNANGNIESLNDAINNNEYVRKGQFDRGLSEVSAPVVNITATSTATGGTISSSDLQVLQGNKSAIIRFNNELYYFMDDEYKSGYLTYSHVGVDAGVQWVKNITITISSLSWVLTKSKVGGTKLYRHSLYCTRSAGTSMSLIIINTESNEYKLDTFTPTTLYKNIVKQSINILYKDVPDNTYFTPSFKLGTDFSSYSKLYYLSFNGNLSEEDLTNFSNVRDTVTEV